ncbi:MAG: NifU family protein [Candidatus Aminicenantes bacterium]|nr:MAG: NifU family protein [Candidatus Aminicenantes bacterium]RLE03728.1 MAG: NifU family protein [Candidatus Aminicenantes bacterium]
MEQNESLEQRVQKALDQLRPHLQADGGDVELVEVTKEGVVKVRLLGACVGCPMRQITLTQGISRFIKKSVPEVKEIEAV